MAGLNHRKSMRATAASCLLLFLVFASLAICLELALPQARALAKPSQDPQFETVRTAAFEAQGEFFKTDEKTGVKSGYAYKFLTDIADHASWSYDYTNCGWSVALDKLIAGEIDIMADVTYTEERAKKMLFSAEPMGTEAYYIFVAEGSELMDPQDLKGKTIGVARSSVENEALAKYLEKKKIDCKVVTFDSDADIDGLLESGKIDAFSEASAKAEDDYIPLDKIGESTYYFAITKTRPDLKKKLDKVMSQIFDVNPYYILDLSKTYMDNSRIMRTPSASERAWLAKKKTLRIGFVTNCMPYCSTTEDGEVTGVLADIKSTIQKNYAVKADCVAYEDSETLATDLKSSAIDAAFGLTDNEWVSDENGFSLCDPFMGDSSTIVYIKTYEACVNGKVAITKANSFDIDCIREKLPQADIVVYDSTEDCLDAVFSGEVDGFMDHSNKVYHAINGNAKYRTAKVTGINEEGGLCFCVAKSNPTLYSILNRVNACYTQTQTADLISKSAVSVSKVTITDFITYNAVAVLIATLLLCAAIIAAVLLVSRRTRNLRTLSFKDPLTGLGNRSAYEKAKAALSESGEESLGLAFVDINGLKESNDNQGHKSGDTLIQTTASVLSSCFESRHIFRIGGDEFVILEPGCDRESFETSFARLVRISEEQHGEIMSAGMAWGDSCNELQALMNAAERDMYAMKQEYYSKRSHDRRTPRS